MAERSYYEVTCLCGAVNRPHDRVSKCAACGRTLELHWWYGMMFPLPGSDRERDRNSGTYREQYSSR